MNRLSLNILLIMYMWAHLVQKNAAKTWHAALMVAE